MHIHIVYRCIAMCTDYRLPSTCDARKTWDAHFIIYRTSTSYTLSLYSATIVSYSNSMCLAVICSSEFIKYIRQRQRQRHGPNGLLGLKCWQKSIIGVSLSVPDRENPNRYAHMTKDNLSFFNVVYFQSIRPDNFTYAQLSKSFSSSYDKWLQLNHSRDENKFSTCSTAIYLFRMQLNHSLQFFCLFFRTRSLI